MRELILWAVLGIVLVVGNLAIVGKERVLAGGETMLLTLAPRDPRSLLQGDYMALRYAIANEIEAQLDARFSIDGTAVVRLDANAVARFVRVATADETLAAGERRLGFRRRGPSLRIAGDAFFFEEGQQDLYADARYGELRVDEAGAAVLVGLRDAGFAPLGPQGPD